MSPSILLVQLLSGLAYAMVLFLIASGLTLIFGVTRVVNFAHGSLYMLAAYVTYTLATVLPLGAASFYVAVVLAAVSMGVVGLLIEVLLLRRVYRAPELYQLLLTFALVLVIADVVKLGWGSENKTGPTAPGLSGSVPIAGQLFPTYDLALIVAGPLVAFALWWLFYRTRWGVLIRAATQDREMVAALGVDQSRLFTAVFALGAALAGLGGALQVPRQALTVVMDTTIITEAFVVVVIGGMGSVPGALLAAVVIGVIQAFGVLVFPKASLAITFVVMAIVLIVRPWGLLGRPEAQGRGAGGAIRAEASRAVPRDWLVGVLAALIVVPPFLPTFHVWVLVEILAFALFAASLHLLMGTGGMVSFGHAAAFGTGAYGAALAMKLAGASMPVAFVAGPVVAAVAALVIGFFCVRLSSIYFAMLTLAFAQIAWAIVHQWYDVTGGDNGILGVWPDPWAAPKLTYYYLALGFCLGATLLLRRIIHAPFGYALRAQRDSPLRAEAIGIDGFRIRWLAFALAAGMAGIAGGFFAYGKGSVFPTFMAIPRSVDVLLMVLLGGVQTLSGPIVGALAFAGLQEQLARFTEYWRLVLGCVIVALVLFFPQGLAGAARAVWERRHGDA